MLHAKFQASGSGEDDFLKCLFFQILPSWSCDLDHLYKLLLSLPKKAPYEIWL